MDSVLRNALGDRGLPSGSSERDAQDYYAHLSLDEKAKLGLKIGQHVASHSVEPLSTRNEPATQTRDLMTRNLQLRSATINETERSIEAVISTDEPVEVWDWRGASVIDEILLADGARLPAQMPMLAAHSRWSLDDVIGSIRNIRVEGGNVIGRLYFDIDGEPDGPYNQQGPATRAWNKVRRGHLTDVSAGYRIFDAVEIQPSQSATVKSRQFTAGKKMLRVATDWTPKEGSPVPIGADQKAKIREDVSTNSTRKEGSSVNPQLRAFLESLGLRKDASDAEAQAYFDKLSAADKARAEAAASANSGTPPANDGQRSEPPAQNPPPEPGRQPEGQTASEAARQAVTAERDRVRQLRELAGNDVPEATLTRAIDEGWDVSRASGEFLTAVRQSRSQNAPPVPYTPSAYTGPTGNANARALAAGLMLSTGTADPTQRAMHNGRREPSPADRLTAQDAEQGHRYARMSAIDLLRECIRLDTGRMCWDPAEAFELARAAPSGGTLAYVFTTNVYAKVMDGWAEVTDTTAWCDEEDVPNFLLQEDISLSANASLEQLPRGGTAKDATISDTHETYKIARFAKKATADEQDWIDDRLGAIMRMQMELGRAARRLRPDLVYSILLENPKLTATGGALFNSTAIATAAGHANLTAAALGSEGLKAAISAMYKQRDKNTKAQLNVRPRFLLVPAALEWAGRELLTSGALAKVGTAGTVTTYVPINVLSGEGMTLVIDDRVGAAGVVDPRTKETRAGSDTNWFLSAGGSRTIRVAYRRGTNRQPVLRSFVLDKGQWGLGWDLNFDIGAKAMDYPGLHKSTGAG